MSNCHVSRFTSDSTPFAGAIPGDWDDRSVANVQRAVFIGIPGFGSGRTAASFSRGIAVNLLEKWAPAIGNVAVDDAQRAALTNRRALGPVGGVGA